VRLNAPTERHPKILKRKIRQVPVEHIADGEVDFAVQAKPDRPGELEVQYRSATSGEDAPHETRHWPIATDRWNFRKGNLSSEPIGEYHYRPEAERVVVPADIEEPANAGSVDDPA